jgi:hypothetical protein
MKGKRIKLLTIHFLLFTILFSFLAPIQTQAPSSDTITISFNPEGNNPPLKPINPRPSHGSTDIRVPVTLSVDVYDDSETYVDVFFYNASNGVLIGVDFNVPADWSTATVVWNESIKGRICYWYAIARDPEGLINQSDTWIFATRPNQPPIIYNNEYPQNESTNIPLNPTCRITIGDEDADNMTIFWYENSTGSWIERQRNSSVQNGTYYWTYQNATEYFRTYFWKVAINTSLHNTTAIFHFRTIENEPLTILNPNPENRSTDVSTVTDYWYITIEDSENDSINWTIETFPNIGNTSQNNDINGQKACPLSGMISNTTYIVYVNASDSGNGSWINETFWFKTAIEGAPTISNEYPPNANTNINLQPLCSIDVHDNEGDNLTIYWYDNSAGYWILRQNDTNVTANSTVFWRYSLAVSYNTRYYWRVIVDDGIYNVTKTFYFTTKPSGGGGSPPPPPGGGGGYTPPPNQHPIANITGQFLGVVNETLVLYAYYSYDPDGYITGYRWDFNNDGEYDTDWLDDLVISHSYNRTGNYTVRLQIKDNLDAITTSDPILIRIVKLPTIKKLPVANIDGSYSGFVEDILLFSSRGSFDPDGYITNYTWNFGDGTISYLENPKHSYSKSGNYTVSLTVRDNNNLTNSTLNSDVIILDIDEDLKKKDKEQPLCLLLILIMAIVVILIILFIRSKKYRFTVLIEKVNKPNNSKKKKVDLDILIEKLPKEIIETIEIENYNSSNKSEINKDEEVHNKIDNLLLKKNIFKK